MDASSLLDTSSTSSPAIPRVNSEQDREERLQQRAFTLAMGLTSLIGLVALTYETRWISALGTTQLQAYSIGHSACFYLAPLSSLWAGVTAKVGQAIGREDDAQVSRLLKMTLVLVACTVVLTWIVYGPFGKWLLVSIYETDSAILPDALAYLRIKTLGEWSVEYFADAGSCILQGLQELRLTVALNLFGGVYTFIAEWFVLVNRRWPVPFDATLHFSREAILAAFVAVWLHRWLRKHGGRYQPFTVGLRRSDWWAYCRDSTYLLAAGYIDLAVSAVAGILTARLSVTDAAANLIVARVQSYPLIFTGALTTVATTLGSRYLGERQQSRFLQLGVALLSWASVFATACGLAIFFFARPVYGFFTDDAPTLLALEPTARVLPIYIAAQLINAVTGGLVLAAQEWVWLPVTSALSLSLIYAPAVAWVTHTGRTSITSLLAVNTGFVGLQVLCKLAVVCVLVPRKLRRDEERESDLALGTGRLSMFDSLFESTRFSTSTTHAERGDGCGVSLVSSTSMSPVSVHVGASKAYHSGGLEGAE